MTNTLYYGDNLPILRSMASESVDLIYLDPPFNSSRSYNVLFKDESGVSSDAQITAFDDTWHWGQSAEEAYRDLIQQNPGTVDDMIAALRRIIGTNQMLAYLVMMAARLIRSLIPSKMSCRRSSIRLQTRNAKDIWQIDNSVTHEIKTAAKLRLLCFKTISGEYKHML